TEVREMNVGSDGRLRPVGSDIVEASRLMIPLITAFLLTSSIFVSSGYMLRAVVEEKTNRTIEVLFSSVRPSQLLCGKILGLSGAAVLQMTIYSTLSGLSILSLGSGLNISAATLALALLYGAFGFLFYAGLLTGAGIVVGNVREGSQVAAIGGLCAISPLLFLSSFLSAPNGTLARVLSYIPLTAPVTMLFRLNLADVPLTDRIGALVVLALATLLAVLGAARLLRTASLLYGKRAGLLDVLRMLTQS
ncbi:MAG: ABC transporter permease, partial [Pyrinomonadaceae bacterium]